MRLGDSEILQLTISKLLPLILMFSFYMFSYGGNFPGGGFQAGVIFGTIIVMLEVLFDYKIKSDLFYSIIEFFGILFLLTMALFGLTQTGVLFGDFYIIQGQSLIYSNIFIWFLNLSIYMEVAGSIVLIFRNFIDWKDEDS